MLQLAIATTNLPCMRDQCPVSERCEGVDGAVCFVHASYMQEVTDIIFNCGKDEANVKIAAHMLFPLYTQLFKLHIYEMSLGSPMLVGRHVQVNPVYREMRATMKDITQMWKILDLAGSPNTPAAPKPIESPQASYFDMLTEAVPDPGTADVALDPEEVQTPRKKAIVSENVNEVLTLVQNFGQELENDPALHAVVEQGDLDISVSGDFDPRQLPKDAEQEPPSYVLTKGGKA